MTIHGLEHFENRNLSTAVLDWSGVVPHGKRTERTSMQVTQTLFSAIDKMHEYSYVSAVKRRDD